MGLQEVFKAVAQTIVKAFGNVPVTVTYTTYGLKSYDDVTEIETTPQTDYPGIDGFLISFNPKEYESDESILSTDLKGLIASNDLPVKPIPGHELLVTTSSNASIRSGDKYNVMSFTIDPAEAMYIIHLRAVT